MSFNVATLLIKVFLIIFLDFISYFKGIPKDGSSIYERTNGEAARFFEAQRVPIIKHDKVGLVSMINNGKGKFGSQVIANSGFEI